MQKTVDICDYIAYTVIEQLNDCSSIGGRYGRYEQ